MFVEELIAQPFFSQSHGSHNSTSYQNVNDDPELDISLHTLMHQVPDDENSEDSGSEQSLAWLDEEEHVVIEKRNHGAEKKIGGIADCSLASMHFLAEHGVSSLVCSLVLCFMLLLLGY